jgi:thioredoxin-related protein
MKNCFGMLYFLFLLGSLLLSEKSHAQLKTYQFEQIDSLQQVEKRIVLVFIHTDWCKYCQAMRKTTFKNKDVIKLINEKFYFIDLDAEQKKSISFKGKKFKYKPNGTNIGIHELATELGTIGKQINYPTLCVLNEKNEIVFQYGGFLTAKELLKLLGKL